MKIYIIAIFWKYNLTKLWWSNFIMNLAGLESQVKLESLTEESNPSLVVAYKLGFREAELSTKILSLSASFSS